MRWPSSLSITCLWLLISLSMQQDSSVEMSCSPSSCNSKCCNTFGQCANSFEECTTPLYKCISNFCPHNCCVNGRCGELSECVSETWFQTLLISGAVVFSLFMISTTVGICTTDTPLTLIKRAHTARKEMKKRQTNRHKTNMIMPNLPTMKDPNQQSEVELTRLVQNKSGEPANQASSSLLISRPASDRLEGSIRVGQVSCRI